MNGTMDTPFSKRPHNLDRIDTLTINQPCTADDVYRLICDRKNIKTVIVCGTRHSRQEVENTEIGQRLGRGVPIVDDEDIIPPGRPATARAVPTAAAYREYTNRIIAENPTTIWNTAPVGVTMNQLDTTIVWDEIAPIVDDYSF